MFNLIYIKNQKFNETKLVEVLFYTFPLAFIIGNLAVTINTLLFAVASLFLIRRKQLAFRFENLYWLLIAFFLYLFLSTIVQFNSPGLLKETVQNWPLEHNPIIKSFMLVRFVILIMLVDILISNKILNIKKFFLSCLFCTSFVSVDIIFQYLIGFDLFGIGSQGIHNSGPFGDEPIAGSYLQKLSFFSIFYVFIIFKNNNLKNKLGILIIALHSIAILLAGNKMPMILFLFGCVLLIIFVKNLRFSMSLGMIIFLSTFFVIAKSHENFRGIYFGFFNEINFLKLVSVEKEIEKKSGEKKFKLKISEKKSDYLASPGHAGIYRTSIKMWKEKPLFGFGLKSFRIKCWDILKKNDERMSVGLGESLACSTHSHNYYLELLTEAGIIGISLIIIFILITLKDSYYYIKKQLKINSSDLFLFIPIVLIFFLEIFPLKSTGSFFTTWNATLLWLNVGLLLGVKKKSSRF